jgi:hypothetical protein
MFTTPLSTDEYRILLDAKYSPDAEKIQGWALRDEDGRIRGWHPHQSGSHSWAHASDAFKSFVPDTNQRRKLLFLGCQVVATTGIQDLIALLHAARGDNINPAEMRQP